ncbi:protein KRI1 homolog isoform X2 [Thalassophryne amazonica]|uniref:protein KRI1 homolog isoform X2 n=1 Tax=Thalassophryne amazonica TaxID=390379 RepID=UPI001470F089|nr:protein KRI1 homolog isoform X2 [Thalassophryne amazonica]
MAEKAELKINNTFAQKYEKYRQKEELQRLKDRYGDQTDDSKSSESSSDESEVELDPAVERDFYRTLSLLKKKDPKVYQKDTKFYSEVDASTSDVKPSMSKTVIKPMYLKDYERKVILEKEGKYDDDEDSDSEEAAKRREKAASPSYIQEQKELRESFRKFVQDSDEDDSDEEGVSQLLTRRDKTQEEKDKEEADFVEWLKGQAELEGSEELKDMKYLRDYWNDPELDEKERFLRDYVLKQGYRDDDDEGERIPTYEEVLQDEVEDSEEEGEMFLARQADFERSYNFRFEEPDAQQIKTYPRSIATSVRSKDDSRKRKREEVKQRKAKEKEQKHEQLKQLKNLKRNEIMEKLKRLQELTGNEQLAFSQEDIERDFDPQQHDQLMQKVFGDEYYGEEEEEKPQFDDDDDLEEHWNWDTWMGGEEGEYEASEPHCEDDGFIMDADYDPNQQATSKKKKKKDRKMMRKEDMPQMGKKRKKSYFAEVLTKNKPVFDPQEKSFEQYLDEYYKLDYEDVIDDLPCRFRYRQVLPNDFGLSTNEILSSTDKELNQWCSLRKTCMFRSDREEMSDLKNYKIKAQNKKKKQEILRSVYSEEDNEVAEAKTKVGKKRRERMKNAENQNKIEEEGDLSSVLDSEETLTRTIGEAVSSEEEEEAFLIPKKKKCQEETQTVVCAEEAQDKSENVRKVAQNPKGPKKKPRHSGGRLLSRSFGVKIGGREFSKQRLEAYGLNPKRLYFRQLGRQKRKAQEKKEKQKNRQ